MAEKIGSKVRIFSEGVTYEGTINSIDTRKGRVTLEKTVDVTTNRKESGLRHFFHQDIQKIQLIQEQARELRVVEQENGEIKGPSVLARKINPCHLKKLRHVNPSDLILQSGSKSGSDKDDRRRSWPAKADSVLMPKSKEDAGNKQGLPFETLSDLAMSSKPVENGEVSSSHTILSSFNEQFREAINFIEKHGMVGFGAEGIDLGRKGTLCYIQIGTPSHVFLFDIVQLGEQAFGEGLKAIIENSNIQKITHDCRFISDMLKHQYDVKLVNVFDTQVASVLVYKIFHGNDLPVYVESLSCCIFHYLDISPEDVFISRVRDTNIKEDLSVWAERPPTHAVVDAAVKNVKHLLPLRTALMHKLLTDLVDGIDIYLSIVRDGSDKQAEEAKKLVHELPREFENIRSCAEERRAAFMKQEKSEEYYDKKGFRHNVPVVRDPHVKLSMDGVWYKTNGEVVRNISPEPRRSRGRAVDRRNRSLPRSRSRGDDTTVIQLAAEARKEEARVKYADVPTKKPDFEQSLGMEFFGETTGAKALLASSKASQKPSQSFSFSDNEVAVINDTTRNKSPVPIFTAAGCESKSAIMKKGEVIDKSRIASVATAATDHSGSYFAMPDSCLPLVGAGAGGDRFSHVESEKRVETDASVRLMRYLRGETALKLHVGSDGSDSDGAGHVPGRRKVTGSGNSVETSPLSNVSSGISDTESVMDARKAGSVDSKRTVPSIQGSINVPKGKGRGVLKLIENSNAGSLPSVHLNSTGDCITDRIPPSSQGSKCSAKPHPDIHTKGELTQSWGSSSTESSVFQSAGRQLSVGRGGLSRSK